MFRNIYKSIIDKGSCTPFLLLFISVFVLIIYVKFNHISYLTFSDSAKFAIISRNIINKIGYKTDFLFFDPEIIKTGLPLVSFWIPPLMPLAIAGSFLVFGVTDLSVILVSAVFFIALVIITYLLAEKLFGRLAGTIASLAVIFNPDLLRYAISGASETLFAFLIVLVIYLLSFKKKWPDLFGILTLVLMYFARPQGFIYISGAILFWLVLRFKYKKSGCLFLLIVVLGLLVDKFILSSLSGKYFLYSITERAGFAITQSLPGEAVSDSLRGGVFNASLLLILKKGFYNIYNFYKLLPQIVSPYLIAFSILGFFVANKNNQQKAYKTMLVFSVLATILVTALTIPFFRYLHPVIPLLYILAGEGIVSALTLIFKGRRLCRFSGHKAILLASILLVLFFAIGQTMGAILLDSRFVVDRVNESEPPSYVRLSEELEKHTSKEDVVITNLDTWGSWYGERKTVWFPLKPDQLISSASKEIFFDAIYLTSYLMDDENYYMGEEWRDIFENPESHNNNFINENFKLKGIYRVSAEETYEKQEAKAILLVRKEH